MTKRFKNYGAHAFRRQSGAALILIVFILSLAIVNYLAKSYSLASLQQGQDSKAAITLADAKAALIGYTYSRMGAGERLGDMPLPDRLLTPTESPPAGGPPNYDGITDSCVGSGAAKRCLGRLPWKTLGLSIDSPSQSDLLGYMPWYGVSANLVDPACLLVINPGILTLPLSAPYVCGSATALPHPWLTVRDYRGNILSNRVAVVLILPGKPLSNQSRPSNVLADASSYLDTYTVDANCSSPCVPGTYSNSDLDNDFIMASPLTSASTSSSANDRLIYITIEELMDMLEKRAGKVAAKALKNYRDTNGYYPYASQLGTTSNYSCEQNQAPSLDGLKSGMLPVDHQICTVTTTPNSSVLSCGGKTIIGSGPTATDITSIQFTRAVGSPAPVFSFNNDDCSVNGNQCTCSGEGLCAWVTIPIAISTFTISETAASSTGVNGNYQITGGKFTNVSAACTHANFPSKNASGCSLSNAIISCSNTGSFSSCGDAALDSYLPSWFRENNWQDYIYYRMSRPLASDFVIGDKPVKREAVIITVGKAITNSPFASKGTSQVRPSCNALNDYLDSVENTNNDLVFDGTAKTKSSNYNDQSFLVAPE